MEKFDQLSASIIANAMIRSETFFNRKWRTIYLSAFINSENESDQEVGWLLLNLIQDIANSKTKFDGFSSKAEVYEVYSYLESKKYEN